MNDQESSVETETPVPVPMLDAPPEDDPREEFEEMAPRGIEFTAPISAPTPPATFSTPTPIVEEDADLLDLMPGHSLRAPKPDPLRPWKPVPPAELVLPGAMADALAHDVQNDGASHDQFVKALRKALQRRGITRTVHVVHPGNGDNGTDSRNPRRVLFPVKPTE